MSIRFACRNGHLLKADVRHAGRKMKCPRCRVSVWVPQPAQKAQAQAPANESLTDTQAVRLLGSYHPGQRNLLSAPSSTPRPDERPCPKCHTLVPGLCRVCPSCNTYLGVVT